MRDGSRTDRSQCQRATPPSVLERILTVTSLGILLWTALQMLQWRASEACTLTFPGCYLRLLTRAAQSLLLFQNWCPVLSSTTSPRFV